MIPDVYHYVFLSPDGSLNPFELVHYLAIKSAYYVNRPKAICFHCNVLPEGELWEKAKPYVSINMITPPKSIFGNQICHVAHQADIVRLEVLRSEGGVYLDMDTICVKPLHDFYSLDFAMGQQLEVPTYPNLFSRIDGFVKARSFASLLPRRVHGLCNAVIFSGKHNRFADLWLDTYKTFRSTGHDEHWDEHSVRMPRTISKLNPGLITELNPYAFHYPLYDPCGLAMLFEKVKRFRHAYVHHLWQTQSWDKYLSALSAKKIATEDTTYNRLARELLP